MIEMHIARLCAERDIKNPTTVLRKLGIGPGIIDKYMKGKVRRLPLDHIEKLCLLFRCQPNDLFTWIPDNAADDYPENPLQSIKAKPTFDLAAKIKNMSLKEIKEKFGE